MNVAIAGLAHVGIRVADAGRSARFYRDLGFEWVWRDPKEPVHVLRHASGLELNLVERARAPARNVLMDDCVDCPGYTHIALKVADARALALSLAAAGVTITEGPVQFGDGSTAIFIRDPDRNVVEFNQAAA